MGINQAIIVPAENAGLRQGVGSARIVSEIGEAAVTQPLNLRITDVTEDDVTLQWDEEDTQNATQYIIYRQLVQNAYFGELLTITTPNVIPDLSFSAESSQLVVNGLTYVDLPGVATLYEFTAPSTNTWDPNATSPATPLLPTDEVIAWFEQEVRGSWLRIGIVDAPTRTFIDDQVRRGLRYCYYVTAYSDVELSQSRKSNTVCCIVPGQQAAVPRATYHLANGNWITSAAADFDAASSEYLSAASNSDLQGGADDWWISGWFTISDDATTVGLVSKGEDGTSVEYQLDYSGTDQRFRIITGNTTLLDSQLGIPKVNTWYFILAWVDRTAQTLNLRINNLTEDTTALGTAPSTTTEPLVVGAGVAPPVPRFDYTIRTSTTNETFTLPLDSSGTYNMLVDWGDGSSDTITVYNQAEATHTYATAGDYDISMGGTCTRFTFGNVADADKLIAVSEIGAVGLTNLDFYGCNNWVGPIPTGLLDNNPGITTCSTMFTNCSGLTSIPAGLFDALTLVTSMGSVFQGCTGLDGIVPAGLFDNNTAVADFANAFVNAQQGITTLPSGLFANNISVTSYLACFQSTDVDNLPADLFGTQPSATNFQAVFNSCSELSAIPSGLFDGCTAATIFTSAFSSNTSLTSIPTGLFDNCPNVTTFNNCFSTCGSLPSVPSGLFDANLLVTDFGSLFSACSALVNVPSDIFLLNNAVTSFNATFLNCTGYTTDLPAESTWEKWGDDPAGIDTTDCYCQDENATNWQDVPAAWCGPLVTSFNYTVRTSTTNETFTLPLDSNGTYDMLVDWGDSTSDQITSYNQAEATHTYAVAGDYDISMSGTCTVFTFDNNANAPQLISVETTGAVGLEALNFWGCYNWTGTLPSGLLTNNTSLISLTNLFYNCTGLTGEIPAGFCANLVNLETMNSAFRETNLTATPADMFDNCPALDNIDSLFFENNALSNVRLGTFDGAVNLTIMSNLFVNVATLTSIDANIFAKNTLNTTFYQVFSGTGLIDAPSGLFANNTAVTGFGNAFWLTSNLATVASDLFAANTAATNMKGVFGYCYDLVSVPAGLFASNTAVTSYDSAFLQCTGLTTVPAGLFDNCPNVTTFASLFSGCTSLNNVDENLFANNNVVTSFNSAFLNCTGYTNWLPDTSTWEKWGDSPPSTDVTDCYTGCDQAGNFVEVPLAWGGPQLPIGTIRASDSFDRADNTSLGTTDGNGNNLSGGLGGNGLTWVKAGAGDSGILNDRIVNTSGASTLAHAYVDAGITEFEGNLVVIRTGTGAVTIGILFSYIDDQNYGAIVCDFSSSLFALFEVINGTAFTRDSVAITFETDTYYNIAVSITQAAITGELDGGNQISATPSNQLVSTLHGVNLFADNANEAAADNFNVWTP